MCSERNKQDGRADTGGFRLLNCKEVEKMLSWYRENGRTLPWRTDPRPYHVWLSEVMLQQTRVEAVLRYYERFLKELPDVRSLAGVPDEKLMKLWEGLGYYSRARQLKKAAGVICGTYGGELPADPEKLRKLPGIGPYTAGAVSSIAFGLPEPAVDGNVLRVTARLSGCKEDISEETAKRHCENAVRASIPKGNAAEFTQAMMEVGALVCVPNGSPKCGECPFRETCEANLKNMTEELPARKKLKQRRIEEKTVLLLLDGDRVWLRKRPAKGLLAGLYELPNAPGRLTQEEAVSAARTHGFQPLRTEKLQEAKHIFTHLEWHMTGWLMYGYADPSFRDEPYFSVRAGREDLENAYALPSAFSAYLRVLKEKLPPSEHTESAGKG